MNGLKTKAKINVCLNKLNEKHCRLVGMIFIFSMKFIFFGHFGINMVWIYPKSMSFLILCDINAKRLIISFSAHPLLYQLPAVSPITKSRFARYPVFGKESTVARLVWFFIVGMKFIPFGHFGMNLVWNYTKKYKFFQF